MATPLTPERQQLVVDHTWIVPQVVRRVVPQTRMPKDDLVSFGNFGLVDAARRFEFSRGVEFRYPAWARVSGEIRDGIRRERRHHPSDMTSAADRAGAVHASMPGDDGEIADESEERNLDRLCDEAMAHFAARLLGAYTVEATLDPERRAICAAMRTKIDAAMATLPERDREILTLVLREGQDAKQIAEARGIPHSTMTKYCRDAATRLAKRLLKAVKTAER